MKKILLPFVLVFSVIITCSFTGCGKTDSDSANQTKSLYEHGLDLISLMEEMATNESYLPMYSGSDELKEIISVVGMGDYTQPKAVYKLNVNKDILKLMLEMQVTTDGLSEELMNYVTSRACSGIATQINAQGGANVLAAASVCTAGKTFVSTELTDYAVYLYTYENGLPAVITFIAGEDDTVSASGSFIFYDGLKTDNLDEIKALLEGIIDTIEEVTR